jgi:hypothetical protein
MKPAGLVLICGLLYAVNAGGQTQAGAQAGASANGQASAQASKHGAQASTNESTAAGAAAQGSQGNAELTEGTAFNATLDKSIDSKKCKPGEPVTAHTTEPVKSGGKTILPKGTKMMGHVTQASARAKGQADSQLGIVFDKAVLKNGQEMPMNLAIQALGAAFTGASASADDMTLTPGGAGYGGASAGASGGRGALGGVTSTASGATGGLTNTTAGAGNAVGGTVDAAGRTTAGVAGGATNGATGTLNTAGQFASNSRGVFGLQGVNLNSATSGGTQGSLITSVGKNVHLDSGTRMLLVTQANASATH